MVRSQARGHDGALSARCPDDARGAQAWGCGGAHPREEAAIQARAGEALSVAESTGPWPSNFRGTCRGHWYQPSTAQMGKLRPRRAASPGALGSLSRSRCDRPSPRSTHRPASGPHAALRRPWASELATKLIGSSWRDQGRRKAVGTKRVVLVSVGAGERDQQSGGAGPGRGRRPSSTPDAARRTRRRLGPLRGRSACQSLRTSANQRAPRRATAYGPKARPSSRSPGGRVRPAHCESFRANSGSAAQPEPWHATLHRQGVWVAVPSCTPTGEAQTTFHPLLWPQAPQLQIYYHCSCNLN